MRIGVTLGTRPEIIKLAPLLEELRARGADHCVIHTNQHYDPELDGRFFEELGLAPADLNLNVGSDGHGRQTGRMLAAVERAVRGGGIDQMVVQGDTDSALAGALAAAKLGCPVAHVEAGLRSYDPRMPEEVNRRLIDHLSADLFPPTATARDVLLGESVPGRVHEPVGNTVVDAVRRHSPRSDVPLGERQDRVLLTLHRPENVDDERTLRSILGAVGELARRHGLDVCFPAHPRTRRRLEEFGIALPERVEPAPPQPFGAILGLQATSRLVITDSGGLQEEACVLRTPCVVVRTHTDRPEALDAGAAVLAGVEQEGILAAASAMLGVDRNDWPQPFGDGTAGRRIVDRLVGGRAAICAALVLCLAAALCGCSRSPAPAAVPPAPLWGVVPQQRTTLAQLERLRRGAVASLRIAVEWRKVEPRSGRPPRWADVDEAVRDATRAGLGVLPFVYGSPRWVAPAETALPVASAGQRRAWGRFLRALVGRYGPGGELWREHPDLPRRPIRVWQIWNEPNFFYFADPPDPSAYDRLVELSQRAIGGVDPGARLILGGMFATPPERPPLAYPAHRFLALMYRRDPGIGRFLDGIAIHPYTRDFRRLAPILDRIRATMRRVGDPRAGLWITELGWGSQAGPGAGSLEKGRLGQARQLRGAFRLLRADRARWNLRGVYWFAATDSDDPQACDFCRSAGLFTSRFRPKPAWRAFERLAR